MFQFKLFLFLLCISSFICEIKYNIDCACKIESDNGKFCQEWECTEEEDTGSCFPGDSFAMDWNFSPILMKDLSIGDKIISVSDKGAIIYDEVIGFLHSKPDQQKTFFKISTQNAEITITEKHVLIIQRNQEDEEQKFLSNSIEYEFPRNLKIQNQLMVVDSMNQQAGWERIIKIESVNKKGMYAPLTKSGTLIVDGVLASCYANFKHQKIADLMFQPYQFLYHFFPNNSLLKNNQNTGLLEYANLLMKLSSVMPNELNYQQQE